VALLGFMVMSLSCAGAAAGFGFQRRDQCRVVRLQACGDALQPAWRDFMARLARRYGLPVPPRVRATRTAGPLFVLVVAYRS